METFMNLLFYDTERLGKLEIKARVRGAEGHFRVFRPSTARENEPRIARTFGPWQQFLAKLGGDDNVFDAPNPARALDTVYVDENSRARDPDHHHGVAPPPQIPRTDLFAPRVPPH